MTEQQRFARMVSDFLSWTLSQPGYEVILGEVQRPTEMQIYYVMTKRSKTMASKHIQCMAIDLKLFINGVYQTMADAYLPLGERWESMGGRWGGRFGDNPTTSKVEGWDANHFEL